MPLGRLWKGVPGVSIHSAIHPCHPTEIRCDGYKEIPLEESNLGVIKAIDVGPALLQKIAGGVKKKWQKRSVKAERISRRPQR